MSDIALTELPAQHFVGVRRRAKPEEIGAVCGEILPRVLGWLRARGIEPTGPPMVVYHAHLEELGAFDLQGGFFVPEPLEADGDIEPGSTAAGQAATVVHEGPYQSLGRTWAELWAWIGQHGHTVSQPSWESYVTDPGAEPDPAKWRTQIVVPLDPA